MAQDETRNQTTPDPGEPGSSAERPPGLEPTAAGAQPVAGRSRRGMFGVTGTGDTSGYGGLRLPPHVPARAERPFGGWFDDVADALFAALHDAGVPDDAVQQVTIDRGEITFYVRAEHLVATCRAFRDDPALRFELCSSVSGVDYGPEVPQRLHAVYHLTSMTYRRRVRVEVAIDWPNEAGGPPTVPSVVAVYPTADFQERESWDMFGIVHEGHPALTRILMPDDWEGHPQRKDYPLGGIPVEYEGAEIPPPDQRRSYT
ncbi:NADH-quinone oxidoreductase subunit C [Saccharopolyspora cebuensis]|uniref:NADH-quinone oxidoreductase subunit C n=1 Tax=Saccharopolyspora cebuensis TaxID=418759 RepID=UPI0033714257